MKPASAKGIPVWFIKWVMGQKGFNFVMKRIAIQIEYGRPVATAVGDLITRIHKSGKKPVDLFLLDHIKKSLRSGKTFAESLIPWTDGTTVAMIEASESSNRVAKAIYTSIALSERKSAILKSFFSKMSGPLFTILIMMVLVYYIGTTVVSSLVQNAGHVTGSAEAMVIFGKIVGSPLTLVALATFVLMALLIVVTFSSFTGPVRKRLDRHFPYSVYRKYQGAIWLSNYAALISSGVTPIDALERFLPQTKMNISGGTKKKRNKWLEERLMAIRIKLRQGKGVGDAMILSGYLFPDEDAANDLSIFQDYPGFGERAETVATRLLAETEEWIDRISSRVVFVSQMLVYVLLITISAGIGNITSQVGNMAH